MSAARIMLAGVDKSFGPIRAVDDVTMEVDPGESLVLLGPSGCGKTTLLRLIAGLERPDAGAISIGDRIVSRPGQHLAPEKRGVGMVFQDHALFPHMTVRANIAYGAKDEARITQLLDLVGLSASADRMPGELSGGQQQRVALARALAPSPGVILLDEPFSNLDADLRQQVRDEVKQILRDADMTAIFVTHDQQEAFELADRIAVMHQGRVEQIGSPEEVYHTPGTRFVADSVGKAAFVPATLESGMLRCSLGAFPYSGEGDDGEADLLVRPEDIAIEADGEAEVIERRFQGPQNQYRLRLADGIEVLSVGSSQTLHPLGSKVRVRFEPDHLVVFRGEERLDWVRARAHTGTDLEPR
ncbi:MAG: ABC transporter ATP-binding protein [Actinomycetota bacterium]